MPVFNDIYAEYLSPPFDPFVRGNRLYLKKIPSFMEIVQDTIPTIEEFIYNYRQERIRSLLLNKES